MSPTESAQIADLKEIIELQNAKLETVHSDVREIKVGLEGNTYSIGIVKRLETVEAWKANTQSHFTKKRGASEFLRNKWAIILIGLEAIYHLVEVIKNWPAGLHK